MRKVQGPSMTALHPSKTDLPAYIRRAMIDLLNASLADAVNLASQLKRAHWNVKGPSFIALHELFDAIHTDTLNQVDDLAERITVPCPALFIMAR